MATASEDPPATSDPPPKRFNRRYAIALFVAFVATFVAATTYRASRWDLEGSACSRALAEAQMYGVVREQSQLNGASEFAIWSAEYSARTAAGRRLLDRASEERRNDPRRRTMNPDLLDVDAQIDFTAARTLKSVRDFTDPGPSLGAPGGRLTQVEQQDLRETVIRDRCPHVAAAQGEPTNTAFIDELGDDVKAIQRRSEGDSFVVVWFVAVLVLLTFADATKVRWLSYVLSVLALALFVWAAWRAAWRDDDLVVFFLLGVAAYALVLVAAHYTIKWLRLHDAAGGGGPHHLLLERDVKVQAAFVAALVLLISFAGLFNAVSGAMYSRAGGTANVASAEAASWQFNMLRKSAQFQATAYSAITGMTKLREANLRSTAAAQLLTEGVSNADLSRDSAFWDRDALRWKAVVERLAAAKPYSEDATEPAFQAAIGLAHGPYRDASYPEGFFVERTVATPARMFAQRDALDEVSAAWDQRAALFLGMLASIAVALYLFGESLRTKRSRGAFVLTFFGIVLIAVGGGVGLFAQFAYPIPLVDDTVALPRTCAYAGQAERQPRALGAAICFAAAELRAKQHDDIRAAELYEEAHKLRPGFSVAAYLAVLGAVARPGLGGVGTTLAEEQKLAKKMHRLGRDIPAPLLENLGYRMYLVALGAGKRDIMRDAIVQLRAAVEGDHPSTSSRYHYGLALLADEKTPDAQEQFRKGLLLLGKAPATGERSAQDVEVAENAVADLEYLRNNCSKLLTLYCIGLARTIDTIESSIVRETWPKRLARAHLQFTNADLSMTVTPGGIGWRVPAAARSWEPAALVMLAYRWDEHRSGWAALPELTYQVDPARLYVPKHWMSGFRSFLLATAHKQCLEMKGRYRIEFYRDGTLIAAAERAAGAADRFDGVALREPGIALCYPAGWHARSVDFGTLAARYDDRRTKAQPRRGAAAYGFFASRNFRSQAESAAYQRLEIRRAVDRTLRDLNPHQTGTSGFHESVSRCATYFDQYWTDPHVDYTSPAMTVLGKAWRSLDGMIHVGVVWQGPGAADDLSCRVLTSMTALDPEAPAERETPAPRRRR